jgi:transposase-like protein
MSDDPAPPLCPMCRGGTATLIATLKDARTVDIYLCQHCRAQFNYERSKKVEGSDVLRIHRALDLGAW